MHLHNLSVLLAIVVAGTACERRATCKLSPAEEIGWDDERAGLLAPADLVADMQASLDGLQAEVISDLRPEAGPVTASIEVGDGVPTFVDAVRGTKLEWVTGNDMGFSLRWCAPRVSAPVRVSVTEAGGEAVAVDGEFIQGDEVDDRDFEVHAGPLFEASVEDGDPARGQALAAQGGAGGVITDVRLDAVSLEVTWFHGAPPEGEPIGTAFETF